MLHPALLSDQIRLSQPSKLTLLDRYDESPYFRKVLNLFVLFDRLIPKGWKAYVRPIMNGHEYALMFLHEEFGAVFCLFAADSYGRANDFLNLPSKLDADAPGLSLDALRIIVLCEDDDPIWNSRRRFSKRNVVFVNENTFPELLFKASSPGDIPKELDFFFSAHLGANDTVNALRLLLETSSDFDCMKNLPSISQMSSAQKRIIFKKSRQSRTYSRVRGSAGSGKSIVLAARAAKLLLDGKIVLVVCYNIALTALLKLMINKYLLVFDPTNKAPETKMRLYVTHFHGFVADEVKQIGPFPGNAGDRDSYLTETLPNFLLERKKEPRYDAILVDEGQDFHLNWWLLLQNYLTPNGEMLFVADPYQNLYDIKTWYDTPTKAEEDQPEIKELIQKSKFTTNWLELNSSFRMPSLLTQQAAQFAQTFLPELAKSLLPVSPQRELRENCHLRWVQVTGDPLDCDRFTTVAVDEILRLQNVLEEGSEDAPSRSRGITFLTPFTAWGNMIVQSLRNRGYDPLETFGTGLEKFYPGLNPDELDDRRRQQKNVFQISKYEIRGTTIKSYKGADTRAIVICLNGVPNNDLSRELYVALTRLNQDESGSYLTVVCSDSSFESFGRSWANINTTGESTGEFDAV